MPSLLLAYHFFYPDDVVSARIFSELAVEQQRRGWTVTVVTSNRCCFDPARALPAFEEWNGIRIHRVFRPAWTQSRPLQRLANSGWMSGAWLAKVAQLGRFDAVVVGSDPAFGAVIGPGLRRLLPGAALVHWCFDLYPEAIAAEGAGTAVRALIPIARQLMKRSYRAYDEIVDIGPRMRARLAAYGAPAGQRTLVPWALTEPDAPAVADPQTRAELFPRAKLALLYSGTMGRAHDHQAFLALARACRARSGDDVGFCFSSRGNRQDELRAAVTPADTNVTLVPFAEEVALPARLGAADLHLVSLQPEWAGVVVPSKFFGSLAVGRPVLYAGPPDSEIAQWIGAHDVGLTVEGGREATLVDRLHALVEAPQNLARWQANAFAVYQREFSKQVINDRWDRALRALVARRGAAA